MTINCNRCGKTLGEDCGGQIVMRHAGRTVVVGYTPIDVTCDRCGHVTRFNPPTGYAPNLSDMDKVLK